jgi:WD40 repeat protein
MPARIVDVISSMTFSKDGKWLALAIDGGPIFVYDVSVRQFRTLAARVDNYTDCAFSPDARQLAAASPTTNSTRVLDVATGDILSQVPGQRSVAFSLDGRLVATESSDVDEFFPVELWDASAEKSVGRLVGHKELIESIVFSADGQLLATGSADGTARLWDLANLSERFVLRAHRDGVRHVAFLLDDKSVATASADGTVKIWQVATGRQLLSLDVTSGVVTGMAVSYDGRTLATASGSVDVAYRVDLWPAPEESPELVLGRAVAE